MPPRSPFEGDALHICRNRHCEKSVRGEGVSAATARRSARDARHLVAEQVSARECAVSEPFKGTINVDIRDSVRRNRFALKVSASRLR